MIEIKCKIKNEVKFAGLKIYRTVNSFERMKGLMGISPIRYGLLLDPGNSIHTFFMKESIDVCYLDGRNKIIRIYHDLSPWKITAPSLKVRRVLELPSHTFAKDKIQLGEVVEFEDV